MSMTLEEAIEHAEKVAEENEKISLYTPVEFIPADLSIEQCQNCADDHRQLAKWLKELAERRKLPEIILCKDCKHKGTKNCVANAWTTIFGFGVKDDFYCGLAERRTDE